MTILLLLAGLLLLVGGGEALVRGAGSLGRTVGLSPLVVGLTVVSFATSSPELAVSAGAALSGAPGLAVGGVVGSNIANILLVLGATAIFGAIAVRRRLIRGDIPVMIGLSLLLLLLALDGRLSAPEGLLLLALLAVYLVSMLRRARRDDRQEPARADPPASPTVSRRRSVVRDVLLLAAGLAMLVLGARLLVDAATAVAEAFGVSDLIIGLTVVAAGTSLPELATSIVAALRGEQEMAVGNLVGSNIFNIGAVLGATAVIAPDGIGVDASAVHFDLPVMVAAALVLLPLAFTGQVVARGEGALLVALYAGYIIYLVRAASQHAVLEPVSAAVVWFVLPVTAVWILAAVGQLLGRRRRRPTPS